MRHSGRGDTQKQRQSAAAGGRESGLVVCGRFRVSTAPVLGLTRAAADGHAVLLRIKVIPVASAAPKQEGSTAALLGDKVPTLQHGMTRAGHSPSPTHGWDMCTQTQIKNQI